MKVLVACEYSGRVRDAFIRQGFDAMSCDLLPTESRGPHYLGDVKDILYDQWDLMIAHPPCTYLTVSGLHWNKSNPDRKEKTTQALRFVNLLLEAPIKHIVLENPVGCISSQIRRPDQIIQPYEFYEDASKRTCLWLKNLPLLQKTERFPGRLVEYNGKIVERWSNQTDSGQNNLTPSEDRWKERSTTYQNIADQMAIQWGNYLKEQYELTF